MPYFDESEQQLERIGHVVGDIVAASIYLFVFILMIKSLI
jgi:hypothetical protein